jgi:hypothetical protein
MEIVPQIEEYKLQICIGRKRKSVTDLELGKAAKLIEQIYKRLNSAFNINSFFKKLLKAYEMENRKMFSANATKFGFGVALKDIYELFSLSPAATDYKLENFLWDLGRMYSTTCSFNEYQVELGYSRDVRKMYVIKAANGETIKASTVSIYKKEAGDE